MNTHPGNKNKQSQDNVYDAQINYFVQMQNCDVVHIVECRAE